MALCICHKWFSVWPTHSVHLRDKEERKSHTHSTCSLPLMRAQDILVIYLLHTIISDFSEVKVTEFLRRPDPSLLVAPDLVSASEQNPLHGNWAHDPCTIAKAAFGTQTPLLHVPSPK